MWPVCTVENICDKAVQNGLAFRAGTLDSALIVSVAACGFEEPVS
jgi:hypothetical protein